MNREILAICITIIITSWTGIFYIYEEKKKTKSREFENYHKMIKELVQPDSTDSLYIDRQTAIVYEFRNFKRYYPHIYRTLNNLKNKWCKSNMVGIDRLLDEIEMTLDFVKSKLKK